MREFKEGDMVVVKTMRSPYRGQVGVVDGFTLTGLSARVQLQDGRRPTLRVASLRLVDRREEAGGEAKGAGREDGAELSAVIRELRELRVEVAELRGLVKGRGGAAKGVGGWKREAVW